MTSNDPISRPFRVHLYAKAPASAASEQPDLIEDTAQRLAATRFPFSFEELSQRLKSIERFFFEPDGSFVWRGETAAANWQLDGMVYDYGGRVQRLEVAGMCPRRRWYSLLATIEWPKQSCTAYSLELKRILSLELFDQWLWSDHD